jgi:HK97 family phage major capsid protein
MSDSIRAEIREIYRKANEEGRGLSHGETGRVADLMAYAEHRDEQAKLGKSLGRQLGGGDRVAGTHFLDPTSWGDGTPGGRFIQSAGFKRLQAGVDRSEEGSQWTSGLVEVAGPGYEMKGTLLEGAGSPGSGTGGGLLTVPQVVPGVVGKLYQPVYFEGLLSSRQATGSTVRYVIQGTATSGAAGVAEGGLKPESTLAYSTVDERVKKIATSITTSDELIEDAPAIQTLINGDLGRFINIEVERQLFRGTSGSDEVQGLLTGRGVPVYTAGTAQGNIAEQVFKAMNSMRGSAFLEPDWLVMSPTDYEKLRLLKDSSGQLYFGGPSTGTYGVGQGASASPQITGTPDVVWGKPCYVTPIIGSGTALVGTRAGAEVWNRGGLQVESTNSHSTHFTSNLMATRAERRLALAVYRSNGFVEVRGLA